MVACESASDAFDRRALGILREKGQATYSNMGDTRR